MLRPMDYYLFVCLPPHTPNSSFSSTTATPSYSSYSDDDMESLLSDEEGLGLAEGDELMILDSGFGGFDLSESFPFSACYSLQYGQRVWAKSLAFKERCTVENSRSCPPKKSFIATAPSRLIH